MSKYQICNDFNFYCDSLINFINYKINKNVVEVFYLHKNPKEIFTAISNVVKEQATAYNFQKEIHSTISRNEYLQTIDQLQKHILRGDCYEINFCQ